MKISIVEERKFSISRIGIKLRKNGFGVEYFSSFTDFKAKYLYDSDLYIIDVSLCTVSGFKIIKWLKDRKSKAPIIIIFGPNDHNKIVYGLDIGADDCLVKPFIKDELIARVRALLRRTYKIYNTKINVYKDIYFDSNNKVFIQEDNIIKLTAREVELAEYFIFNTGKLITKTRLINSVWGEYENIKVTDNNINVTISNVRKKLGKGFKLKTLVNRGYILEE